MKVDKRANFCIFFIIAILALGLSNFAAAFTGDFVSASLPEFNETEKMIALDNDNFTPASVYMVYEKKVEVVNETENETENETDNSTEINSTEIEETVNEDAQNSYSEADNDINTDSNSNGNQEVDIDSGNIELDTGDYDNSYTEDNSNANYNSEESYSEPSGSEQPNIASDE